MRKKSHLSLAGYILDVECPSKLSHPWMFRLGSLEPDLVPTFITRRHRIDVTFSLLEEYICKLIDTYDASKGLTRRQNLALGVITHYIADYFTFPHNLEYPGTMAQHIVYEEELKLRFRKYVKELRLQQSVLNVNKLDLKNAEEICNFIKESHIEYIQAAKSIQSDCDYILSICGQVITSLLDIFTEKTMQTTYA